MKLASWSWAFVCVALGTATVSGCGSTESRKGGSGDSTGSGGTDSNSNGSGGTDSNSNGSGGTDSNSNGSGGTDSNSNSNGSGGGGAGGSGGGDDEPMTVECGGETCDGLSFGLPGIQNADACCPDGADEPTCGYDTETLQDFEFIIPTDCQPRDSPGELDDSCPESPPLSVSNISFLFPGCCLPTGKCGYMLDSVAGIITLDLGCIDSTEFLEDQEEPPDCVPAGGEGGASN